MKDEALMVKDAVHKMQLSLLEGIKHENQLSAAGSLISQSDYQDVVTERTIANMCGYPLCSNSLPSEHPWKGHYHISLREHKVYDLQKTYMYCSSSCLIHSRAFAGSLPEERSSTLNPAKLNEVLKLFEGLSLHSVAKSGDLGLSELKILKKRDAKSGEVSLEEWIGPSNAIEGYVPQRDRNSPQQPNNPIERVRHGQLDIISNHVNFASSIITQDEYSILKLIPVVKAEEPEGKGSGKEVNDRGNLMQKPAVDNEVGEDSYRFASAEACARALSQAAESVALGKSDAPDAADIINLPTPHGVDESKSEKSGDVVDTDPVYLKWPTKPGFSNDDLFDSEDSWYDSTPEGFNLTLSPFSTMFLALFAWISSSSLAYIYGRDESCYENYLFVNGREYPRKIVMPDGPSSEIKQTLAGCLARALPGLVAELRLPTPVSTLEQGMGRLLDKMSFLDPLPPFRMKQWQVIALLFLDALSVSRIPALTPHMMGRRVLLSKVLEGAQISGQEYEIMKDLIIPLGRVPRLSTQS